MIWDRDIAFWLFALVFIGIVLVAGSRRRRRAALEQFAESRLLDEMLPSNGGTDLRLVTLTLRIACLIALVFALAGPRWGFRWQEVRREGIDLIIAVDTSRSMLAADVKPNRLERAKLAVLDVLPRLRGDRVGLVPFAGAAFLECPLTLDYSAFSRSLRGLSIGTIPVGGTDLAGAIEVSLDAFASGESRYQAMILITDGEDHAARAVAAAELAKDKGVKIYTVGMGTADGELIPLAGEGGTGFLKDRDGRVIKSRLDEETLGLIAKTTGGAYVRGIGPSLGLDKVFDDHIATMERREISSTLERRHEHRFQIPLGFALALLLLELAISRGRIRATGLGLQAFLLSVGLVTIGTEALAADPMEAARNGFTAYNEGRYDDAVNAYRDALLDEPESALFKFNLATALYQQERFEESAAAFASVAQGEQNSWRAIAAYNQGNSLFRVGEALESPDPNAAIQQYAQSLEAFRQAMSLDPADTDPKHGFEFVTKKLEELEQNQQEQEQEQEQQEPGDQGEDSDSSEKQNSDPDQSESEQEKPANQEDSGREQNEPDGHEESPGQAEEEEDDTDHEDPEESKTPGQPQKPDQPNPDGNATPPPLAGEPNEAERQEAQAILDAAKAEELEPEDVDRGIRVPGGPAIKDW